ncbi:hypothetical protein TNCV_2299111 [Trichonephila clavipes]|nr:hypothetical protein TNCV_2299111 [Trichonephila clavipes]
MWCYGQVCPEVGQGIMAPWSRRPRIRKKSSALDRDNWRGEPYFGTNWERVLAGENLRRALRRLEWKGRKDNERRFKQRQREAWAVWATAHGLAVHRASRCIGLRASKLPTASRLKAAHGLAPQSCPRPRASKLPTASRLKAAHGLAPQSCLRPRRCIGPRASKLPTASHLKAANGLAGA